VNFTHIKITKHVDSKIEWLDTDLLHHEMYILHLRLYKFRGSYPSDLIYNTNRRHNIALF
jgi:hypothetical protein